MLGAARPIAMALAMALAVGCPAPKGGTGIELTVAYREDWGLSQLRVTSGDESSTIDARHDVRILVPDAWAATEVRLVVWGLRSAERWAHGQTAVTPILGDTVIAVVSLARLPCGAWCTEGATTCAGNAVAICGQVDEDSCYEWSEPVPCSEDAPYCSLGTCLATCVDECVPGETRCAGPGFEQVCGQAPGDSDDCLDWLPIEACIGAQTCSSGQCRDHCEDECTDGATACENGGITTCADLNVDGCTEWGPIAPCESGSCSGDACQDVCFDDCTTSTCTGLTLRTCGQFDLDSCLDLSPGTSCVPADACREGSCSPATGCTSTPKVCDHPPDPVCVDSMTRRTYSAVGTCRSGDCDYPYTDEVCPNEGSCEGGLCTARCTCYDAVDCCFQHAETEAEMADCRFSEIDCQIDGLLDPEDVAYLEACPEKTCRYP